MLFILLMLLSCISCSGSNTSTDSWGGRAGEWDLLLHNSGVVAMHMALTHRDTVVIFDQTGAGPSAYPLPRCHDPSKSSCSAHSIEYTISSNTIRPLTLRTDTWCSSGSFLSDGTLIQTGGFGSGYKKIRYFRPCSDGRCDWTESEEASLADRRWYASTLMLPDKEDRVIVVGGRRVFSYEFVPRIDGEGGAFDLPLLRRTFVRGEEDNLYPILHLCSDGNLFVFANRESMLWDYKKGRVVKRFPRIPGDGPRSYPSTASSVLLPLDHSDGFKRVEIMVCGGGASGAYLAAKKRHQFMTGLSSCGRMVLTDERPAWHVEQMPAPRLMNDMILLPTGDVLIINGASHGAAGWNNAHNPSLSPYLYKPNATIGHRFSALRPTHIPRMYHSSAILLPDGRILVAGSNTHSRYTFKGVAYPTELRMEAFTPYYMSKIFNCNRPANVSITYKNGKHGVGYEEEFVVRFKVRRMSERMEFHMYAPPFVTHSLSMNQRLLKLRCGNMRGEEGELAATLVVPPSSRVAPAGYYLLTVVNGGIPSKAQWMRIIHA